MPLSILPLPPFLVSRYKGKLQGRPPCASIAVPGPTWRPSPERRPKLRPPRVSIFSRQIWGRGIGEERRGDVVVGVAGRDACPGEEEVWRGGGMLAARTQPSCAREGERQRAGGTAG